MLIAAIVVAVLATLTGSYLAMWLHRDTGPLIVTVAAGCFIVSSIRRS
jgi:ABC-type Mn2+/Zn2+ transport system permease subunit